MLTGSNRDEVLRMAQQGESVEINVSMRNFMAPGSTDAAPAPMQFDRITLGRCLQHTHKCEGAAVAPRILLCVERMAIIKVVE